MSASGISGVIIDNELDHSVTVQIAGIPQIPNNYSIFSLKAMREARFSSVADVAE